MSEQNLIFKRAVPFVAALFIWSVYAHSKPNPTAEALSRAQDQMLARKRKDALDTLLKARAVPLLKANDKKDLSETLKDVAERFLTDKGQRSFELGISQLPSQGANALIHLKEAQTLEDGNYLIEVAIARAHLALEDCTAAKAVLDALFLDVTLTQEIQELQLQSAWCAGDQVQAEAAGRKKLPPALLKTNQAWLKWKQNENERALVLVKEAVNLDPQNPAVLYWLWRMQRDQETNPPDSVAQVFAKRCRGKEADIRRRSSSMIEFCLRLAEVEAYLKGRGTETSDGSP